MKKYRNSWKGRSYRLQYLYGITLEQKAAMHKKQRGRCKLCRFLFRSVDSAHVDHNHETGEIRSLLCRKCNWLIGILEVGKIDLRKVKEYLKEWATQRRATPSKF
jgi:hypothetical protein